MTDEDRYEDPQRFLMCPYDEAHSMPKFRLAKHLIKCRKQHLDMANDIKDCPYNVTHKVPRCEMEHHKTECADRESIHTHITKVGGNPNDIVPLLVQNTLIPLHIPTTENWDQETNYNQNIIKSIQESAGNRKVLQCFSNEPPAVRKAKREEARKKMNRFINEEEKLTKDVKSKSSVLLDNDVDDSISYASFKTGASENSTITVNTDFSYNTALTSTRKNMEKMQLEDNKPKQGRGRSKMCVAVENVEEVGFGRGRKRQV